MTELLKLLLALNAAEKIEIIGEFVIKFLLIIALIKYIL